MIKLINTYSISQNLNVERIDKRFCWFLEHANFVYSKYLKTRKPSIIRRSKFQGLLESILGHMVLVTSLVLNMMFFMWMTIITTNTRDDILRSIVNIQSSFSNCLYVFRLFDSWDFDSCDIYANSPKFLKIFANWRKFI